MARQRVAAMMFCICVIGSPLIAAPATQPSREARARARAEAELLVRPAGPLRAAPVAFNPVPRTASPRFAQQYQRYAYSSFPQLYVGCGYPYAPFGYFYIRRPVFYCW